MPHAFDPARDVDWNRTCLFKNTDAPLFLNTVGSWAHRPDGRTRIAGLWLTGDYCRSTADLTTMESTVESGLETTRWLLAELGLPDDVRHIRLDKPLPWYWHVLRALGWPIVHALAIPGKLRRLVDDRREGVD